jgi:hypothetical protein
MPDDYLKYRVLPDSAADEVDREKLRLQRLQNVLDWQPYWSDPDVRNRQMPALLIDPLKETTAYKAISTWVELRTAEAVIEELAGEFGGADPLKPRIRQEVEDTKRSLLEVQEHLRFLNMEVVLREPLAEELEEMREWARSRMV